MPGLFPEHCSVVMVCVFLRNTGHAIQAAKEPGLAPGVSCKQCKQGLVSPSLQHHRMY